MSGYERYKEKSICSMTNAEQLVLLYDEAIKHLAKAEYALEDEEYELFERYLRKAGEIVRYLIRILDMRQPISAELKEIYDYIILCLSKIKAGRQRYKDEIGRLKHILSELRDAFEEAGKRTNDMHIAQQREVLG